MGAVCYNDRDRKEDGMIHEGNVVNVNFIDEEGKNPQRITIYDKNTLRKAIEIYQKKINKVGYKIDKAIYGSGSTQKDLSLNTALKDLNINLYNTITVFFK